MKIKPDTKPPKVEAKTRRCLMCGSDFKSEWSGERICKRCRSSHNWRHGAGSASRPLGQATQS
jgi:hypothetical protein